MLICTFITVLDSLLMVLTILYNFVTISNEFCINLCVQIEEYVHFYRFCCEEKPTHIVSTYLSGLYTEYPPGL